MNTIDPLIVATLIFRHLDLGNVHQLTFSLSLHFPQVKGQSLFFSCFVISIYHINLALRSAEGHLRRLLTPFFFTLENLH